MLSDELETATDLALSAGKLILKHYDTDFTTEEKLGADNYSEPVTIADREASRLIVDGLAAEFADDAILSEEEPDDVERRLATRRVWIVDPLDGTAGFVKKDGDFSVQIGLAIDGKAVLGVVLQPFHDRLHYAMEGSGAFLRQQDREPVRLQTSQVTSLTNLKLAMSRNHASPRMKRVIEHFGFTEIIRRGSVGLKVGLIAEKACDIYIHPSPRTKIWDTCAPQIILEESGGKFTDLFGGEITYDRADVQNHDGILASNGAVHAAARKHLKTVLAEFGRFPHNSRK
ncbi:MAG: 3'(2'),5'-bisphosphate nucleotidase CysQ [Pyrinomonadaceae bacterium]